MAHWAHMHVNGSICTFPPRGNLVPAAGVASATARCPTGELFGRRFQAVSETRLHRHQRVARLAPGRRRALMRALLDVNVLTALLNAAVVDAARIHDPRQITDVYQLALATRNGVDSSLSTGQFRVTPYRVPERNTLRLVIAQYDMALAIRALL